MCPPLSISGNSSAPLLAIKMEKQAVPQVGPSPDMAAAQSRDHSLIRPVMRWQDEEKELEEGEEDNTDEAADYFASFASSSAVPTSPMRSGKMPWMQQIPLAAPPSEKKTNIADALQKAAMTPRCAGMPTKKTDHSMHILFLTQAFLGCSG